jgi:hypothetical protein
MKTPIRLGLCAAVSATFALAGIASTATGAGAYGAADQPVAQVEISANCTNPAFPLCAPEDQGGVGLGGVWTWAELDSDTGQATVADPSPIDATIAFCGHTQGKSSPGDAGGFGTPVSGGQWWIINDLSEAPQDATPFFDAAHTPGPYYVLDYFPGSGSNDFIAVVPVHQGHYSFHPVNGVTIQTQVAP